MSKSNQSRPPFYFSGAQVLTRDQCNKPFTLVDPCSLDRWYDTCKQNRNSMKRSKTRSVSLKTNNVYMTSLLSECTIRRPRLLITSVNVSLNWPKDHKG